MAPVNSLSSTSVVSTQLNSKVHLLFSKYVHVRSYVHIQIKTYNIARKTALPCAPPVNRKKLVGDTRVLFHYLSSSSFRSNQSHVTPDPIPARGVSLSFLSRLLADAASAEQPSVERENST